MEPYLLVLVVGFIKVKPLSQLNNILRREISNVIDQSVLCKVACAVATVSYSMFVAATPLMKPTSHVGFRSILARKGMVGARGTIVASSRRDVKHAAKDTDVDGGWGGVGRQSC